MAEAALSPAASPARLHLRLPALSGTWIVFVALFALAIAIRLVGLDWHGRHPDENPSAAAKVLSGDLSVSSFYPPLLDYVTAVAYALLYVTGRALTWWPSTEAFRAAYFADPDIFYLTGRLVTAAASALIAPLSFLLAAALGVSRAAAALAGVVAALNPGSVFWARIAKSDVALAPAFVFVAIALAKMVERPSSRVWQATLGLALALAMSVKHSAIFFLAPLLLITIIWSWRRTGARPAIGGWLASGLAALLCWVPLNIGIILDPQTFIDAQRVQASMSLHDSGLAASARAVGAALTSIDAGVPVAVLLLWAGVPLAIALAPPNPHASFAPAMLTFVAATALAMAALFYLGGDRQPTNLWLPYASLIAVAIVVTAAAYLDRAPMVAAGVLALCVVAFCVRLAPIVGQSLAAPNGVQVAAALRSVAPPDSRVLSAIDLAPWLPIARASAAQARARHERLARKYRVALPPSERPAGAEPAGGYTVMAFPFVFGGLETLDPDEVTTVVAYAWPLQPEEWRLDHWRAQGYRYVVADAGGRAHPVAAYRTFYREIDARCRRTATVPTAKPLLWEQEIGVYDCASAIRAQTQSGRGRDGADFGVWLGARRERCWGIVTDEGRRLASKSARRFAVARRSPLAASLACA